MKMDAGLDTGPILAQREEPIRADDTRATLMERLSYVGAELLAEMLPLYLAGAVQPKPQDEKKATIAEQLRKEDGELDWSRSAVQLDQKIRAFTPWPGTFTFWNGTRLKILKARPLLDGAGDAEPGTVVEVEGGAAVATGQGALRLERVQLAGKRAMDIEPFLRGRQDFVSSRLG